MKANWRHAIAALGVIWGGLSGPAMAQEAVYSLELNTAQTVDGACRLTFVVDNTSADNVDASAFEMATFGAEGGFLSMSVFEFGAVLAGRLKVVQFDLNALACEDLSRIVVNGAPQCSVAGAPSPFCFDRLSTANKTDVELRPLPGTSD